MVAINKYNYSHPFLWIEKALRTFGFLVLIFALISLFSLKAQTNVQALLWAKPTYDNTNNSCTSESKVFEFEILYKSDRPLKATEFDIFLNDKPYIITGEKSEAVPLLFEGNRFRATVILPQVNNTLYIKVGNKKTDILNIHYAGNTEKPDLYLFVAGVKNNLEYTDSDAKRIKEMFEEQGKMNEPLYNNINTYYISGDKVTEDEIHDIIKRIGNSVRPNDIFMLYLSSHGELVIKGKDTTFYFICVNFNRDSFEKYTLSDKELREYLSMVKCKKIVFIDACREDGSKSIEPNWAPDSVPGWQKKINANAFFTSCNNRQRSYECKPLGMATFSYAIIQALEEGKAKMNKDSVITLLSLAEYLIQQTPQINKYYNLLEQNPQVSMDNFLKDEPIYKYTQKRVKKLSEEQEKELKKAKTYFFANDYDKTFLILEKYKPYLIASQMSHLGYMYFYGKGTNKNEDEGLKWLLKAAELNDSEAMFKLGEIYQSKQDMKTAKEWYSKSAKAGNGEAAEALRGF